MTLGVVRQWCVVMDNGDCGQRRVAGEEYERVHLMVHAVSLVCASDSYATKGASPLIFPTSLPRYLQTIKKRDRDHCEHQGRAAMEEDPAEESPVPGGEQVERGSGRTPPPPPQRARGAVQHVRERQLGRAKDTARSSKSLSIQ